MNFGKLGATYRGETLGAIMAAVPAMVAELDAVMMISDPAARRVGLIRLFDSASHNQRVILTQAALEILVHLPVRRPL